MGGRVWRAGSRVGRRGRVLAALASVAILATPVGLNAQSFVFQSVRVEGNSRIDTGTILAEAGIAQGQAVSAGELNDAAQAIRASGLFESVEVVPEGSTLVIRVAERPILGRINFEGNRRLTDEALRALVGSVERRVLSPEQAEADTAAITQAYVNEGSVNAVVAPALIPREDGSVDLVFQISEGGVTEVERISFVGNRAFSDRRLRGALETRQAGLLRQLVRADTFVAERVDFDRQALTDFYLSRGYADAAVESVDVNLTAERDAYLVTFNVQEGQRYSFGDVTVTSAVPGADAALFQPVVRAHAGQTYSPVAVENDIARIEDLAARRGINFVRVDPRITRDAQGRTLAVEYALVPGERVFVERIDIEGNATTLDRVIRSQFRTVEGDPFNPREIRRSAERIRALGYFSNADVESREGSAPDQVVIDVNVEEQPTGSLTFGGNYSTEGGPALIAAFTEDNFLGRGQSLSFELQAGTDDQTLVFDFTEPRFLGRDLAFSLDLQYRTTQRASALYDTNLLRVSPSLEFPLGDRSRLSVLAALEATQITDVATGVTDEETGEVTGRASDLIFDEAAEGRVWTTSVGYSYSFDTARDGLDRRTDLFLRFGQELGFGDKLFVDTRALASAQTRVLGEDVTLRATVEGGYLSYFDGASRVTDRFFGGSRVLRGFERGGIGPRDANTDDALGGNAYAVVRLESEFPIGLPEQYGITGGAFVDYGSVWDVGDLRSLSPEDVRYDGFTPRATAGVSVFANTPFGPLRFNFTRPLLAEEFDRTQNFDLTVQSRF